MPQTAWYLFQEEISEYFKSLGFETETNTTIQGIRTTHDIDVLVRTKFMGRNLLWIVEAKKWTQKVNKLQVLGLRAIIDDIGADKGFIISENGFQKGAKEATEKTNVELLTFIELKQETKDFIEQDILIHFQDRINLIRRRYMSHGKRIREQYDLKLQHGDRDYSVFFVLSTATSAITEAVGRNYPIDLSTGLGLQYGELQANNLQQVINWLNLNLNIVDKKILEAEIKMQKDGNFSPILK
ncbi:restriction endonuclease [Chryseobacterium arthrosphaerae]|uniref:restriction endonuclease n=1 Tax=Chryseobacterium arthrosphaerae TaxID=651561 RepID=UPI001F4B2495|nr:restriction endonuclease [Chryseobacterium arthrosphaerae]